MGRTQTEFTPDEILSLQLKSEEGHTVEATNLWGHPSQVLLSADMICLRVRFKSGESAAVYDLPSDISRFESFPVLGGAPLYFESRQQRWYDRLPLLGRGYETATLAAENVDKVVAWRLGLWDGLPDPEPIKTPGHRSRISPLASRAV